MKAPLFDLTVHDPAGAAALAAHLVDERRRGIRPRTLFHRDHTIRRLGRRIAPTPLLELTPAGAERWWVSHDGLAPESRATYLAHAVAFYKWAGRRGHVTVDPVAEIERPRIPPRLPHPIEESNLELALVTAGQSLRAWLVLAAYAGLRAGEIGRLCREHVLDTRTPPLIHVVDGKGGKERVVPIGPVVLAELAPHLTGRRGRLWLPGRAAPESSVTRTVADHLRQLGIPHTCHSLRHRFGTQVYQRSGGDIRMTQDLLGHASPATTAIYAAWDTERAGPVVDLLAENLGRAAPVIRPD